MKGQSCRNDREDAMKKSISRIVKTIILISCMTVLFLLSIPKYVSYNNLKDHIIISCDNEHLYIGTNFYLDEINYMASKGGHVYLYSLEDGSRCYAQYLYAKASMFDRFKLKSTALYYYPLSSVGAEHGMAIDIQEDGSQIQYVCYTVAVFYINKDGSSYLLWKADSYNK